MARSQEQGWVNLAQGGEGLCKVPGDPAEQEGGGGGGDAELQVDHFELFISCRLLAVELISITLPFFVNIVWYS